MGVVTIYRSSSHAAGMRKAAIEVDGEPAGTVSGRGRLNLNLAPGAHTVRARLASSTSQTLRLDITDDRPRVVAIRYELTPDGPSIARLAVAEVDNFNDRGVTMRDLYKHRPPTGNRKRTPFEQRLWVAAVLLMVAGWIISHTVSQPVGVLVSVPGFVVVIVLFFRLFLYRKDR